MKRYKKDRIIVFSQSVKGLRLLKTLLQLNGVEKVAGKVLASQS
jgi:hypothetical protein